MRSFARMMIDVGAASKGRHKGDNKGGYGDYDDEKHGNYSNYSNDKHG